MKGNIHRLNGALGPGRFSESTVSVCNPCGARTRRGLCLGRGGRDLLFSNKSISCARSKRLKPNVLQARRWFTHRPM